MNIESKDNKIVIRIEEFIDQKGEWTTAWAVYFRERVINVEYTLGHTPLTKREELREVA